MTLARGMKEKIDTDLKAAVEPGRLLIVINGDILEK
jgi:hypothetical protein